MTDTVLITGGLGFIGGRLCERLLREGWRNIRLTTSRPLDEVPKWARSLDVHHINFAIARNDDYQQLVTGTETVIHLAALNAQQCADDPAMAIRVNIGATQALVTAASRADAKRFVFVSTAHVYGAPLMGHLDETALPHPGHPYAWSNRAAEDLVLCEQTMDVTVLRLSNGIGAPMDKSANCWMLSGPDFCRQAIEGGEIVLRGDGQEQRDFLPLEDVTGAICRLISRPTLAGRAELFNLGSGSSLSIYDLARQVAARAELRTGNSVVVARKEPAPGERAPSLHYDCRRLAEAGFVPSASLDDEIDRLLELCLSNPHHS